MYKIGEFSVLSKITIKALRYYEKEGLLKPSYVDSNGYRYYETNKLMEASRIISLRQIGFSIEEIKLINRGGDLNVFLQNKKETLEKELEEYHFKISKINYLLGENSMKYEIVLKELPECIVYYKEGFIKSYSDAPQFILQSADECLSLNPNIKCVEPDYCFMEYLDGGYKKNDISLRYSQAVTEIGVSNEIIKFKKLNAVKAVCIYHKGSYENLGETYGYIMKYIEENNLKIAGFPRERYIDGMWNKENVEDYLTEIQVPIIKE